VRILLGLVVAAIIIGPIPDATAWSPSAASIIVPGHALGPVTLGMPATEADAAAARFAHTTGRVIDVLFRDGVVAAAGSAVSMRIDLQLPNASKSFLPRDAIGGQSTLEINGSPDQLVNALGAARVVREGHDKLALIFAGGLVAEVRQTQARGGIVTYLAVQATGRMGTPAIGNLAPWIEGSRDGVAVAYLPIQSGNSMLASGISHLPQWSGEPTESAIVLGRSIGPVALGMPIQKAREAASTFEKQTRCNIDLLAAHDVVIAAGTSWGGCLELQLPREFTAHVGIGGHPLALIRAFGTPLIQRHSPDRAALIFADGLVAHVGIMRVRGGMVSYLAIQPPGWSSVPPIGHFTDWPEARSGEAAKEAKPLMNGSRF
jgi:hypothetical protein